MGTMEVSRVLKRSACFFCFFCLQLKDIIGSPMMGHGEASSSKRRRNRRIQYVIPPTVFFLSGNLTIPTIGLVGSMGC